MEPTSGAPRRGRPVDPTLGPAILEAVLDVLADGGYAGLTTATVARRAGVSTATLYRRWPTKRDLVRAAAGMVAGSEEDVDTGSTAADLRAMLEHKSRALAGRVGVALVALVAESRHDDELADVVRAITHEPTRERLGAILDRAAGRGERPAADADSATVLVLGAIMAGLAFGGGGGGSGEGGPGGADGSGGPAGSAAEGPLDSGQVELLVRALAAEGGAAGGAAAGGTDPGGPPSGD